MLLALETATDRASVAVGRSEADAVESSVSGARRHAASILLMVNSVLARTSATLDDLTAVVVSDGPGSFTGLRVGATVAKALIQTRGLQLWTAPSLLVRAAGTGAIDGIVLAVSDALRGDIYAAAYRFVDGAVATQQRPTGSSPEELGKRVYPPAPHVGRTGGAREITAAAGWEPEYGRPAEAQARWETTHGRSLPNPAGSPS